MPTAPPGHLKGPQCAMTEFLSDLFIYPLVYLSLSPTSSIGERGGVELHFNLTPSQSTFIRRLILSVSLWSTGPPPPSQPPRLSPSLAQDYSVCTSRIQQTEGVLYTIVDVLIVKQKSDMQMQALMDGGGG